MTLALTTSQAVIAVLAASVCVLFALVAAIDTYRESRREYEDKKQRLLIAAVDARLREFEKDHPDRERLGLTKEEE